MELKCISRVHKVAMREEVTEKHHENAYVSTRQLQGVYHEKTLK